MTDDDILNGCKQQNRIAQQELYLRYGGKMLVVCLRYTRNRAEAEDLLQEGFIKVFKHIHDFRNEGSLEGWIRRIMVNTALKQLSKQRPVFIEDTNISFELDNNWSNALDKISEKELLQRIGNLPVGYKMVFNLYVLEGYSHAEIAELLKIKESTSRSQLVKARMMLQKIIVKEDAVQTSSITK